MCQSSHLGVHLCESRTQFVWLAPEDDGLQAGVQRRHLHGNAGALHDLMQRVSLGTDDVLMLGLLHLHRDGGRLSLLRMNTSRWNTRDV